MSLALSLATLTLAFFCFQSLEKVFENHPDGALKSECEARRDADGSLVLHGKAVTYFPDGKVESKGQYADGLRTGAWEFRFPSGRKHSTGAYERGERSGEWKFFRDGGGVELEGAYQHGFRHGEWKTYDASRKNATSVAYFYVRHEDPLRGWTWEGEAQNSKRSGAFRCTRADGSVVFWGEFELDEPQGPWFHFFADGSFDSGWLSASFYKGVCTGPQLDPPAAGVVPAERAPKGAAPLSMAVEAADLEQLERGLAGDGAALEQLLARPGPACRAAIARLHELDLADAAQASLAKRIHEEVLGECLGAGEPWPDSAPKQQRVLLRWRSVVELLLHPNDASFVRYEPELTWVEPAERYRPYFSPPLAQEFVRVLAPAAPVEARQGMIGIGGGTPTRFGGRFGGRLNVRARGGSGTQEPLAESLAWIAAEQDESGAWSPEKHGGESYATLAVTAQCLLAFAGDGAIMQHGPYTTTVRRAARWVAARQEEQTGRIGDQDREGMFQHALASQAIAELAYMDRTPSACVVSDRAIEFVRAQQRSDGSWPREIGGAEGDIATTAACWRAIVMDGERTRSPDAKALERAYGWLVSRAGSLSGSKAPQVSNSLAATSTESRLACTALVRLRNGDDAKQHDLAELLQRIDAARETVRSADVAFLDVQSEVAYQVGADYWERWNKKMKSLLLGVAPGEFSSSASGSSPGGGIMAVAQRATTLEVYFRFGRGRWR